MGGVFGGRRGGGFSGGVSGDVSAGTIKAVVEVDARGVERSVDAAVGGALQKAERKSLSKLAALQGRLNKVGSSNAALFTTGAVGFGLKAGIDAQSNFIEQTARARVVFGKAFGDIERLTKSSADQLGVARDRVLEYGSALGTFFVNSGLTQKSAANYSEFLLKTATNVRSFTNAQGGVTKVLQDIQSGLNGEIEPLRKYGIFLTQTRVAAKAVELGLIKLEGPQALKRKADIAKANARVQKSVENLNKAQKKGTKADVNVARANYLQAIAAQAKLAQGLKVNATDLTQKQRAIAVAEIIRQDTTLANRGRGDFQETLATSLANQQEVERANRRNALAAAADDLLPAVTKTLKAITAVERGFTDLSDKQQKIVLGLAGAAAAVGPLSKLAAGTVGLTRTVIGIFGKGGTKAGPLGKVAASLANPVPVFVVNEGFGGLGGGFPGGGKAGKVTKVGKVTAGLRTFAKSPPALFGFLAGLGIYKAAKDADNNTSGKNGTYKKVRAFLPQIANQYSDRSKSIPALNRANQALDRGNNGDVIQFLRTYQSPQNATLVGNLIKELQTANGEARTLNNSLLQATRPRQVVVDIVTKGILPGGGLAGVQQDEDFKPTKSTTSVTTPAVVQHIHRTEGLTEDGLMAAAARQFRDAG